MRRLALLLALALVAPAGAHAQAPTNPEPPVATTEPVTAIGQTTATLAAKVAPRGADTTVRFEYGTSTAYGLTSAERSVPGTATEAQTVTVPVTGLTANTTYHVRVVATNAAGEVRGTDRTFRTTSPPASPRAPGATTGTPTEVTSSSATLVGSVDPNGQATRVRFEYGTTGALGRTTGEQDAGAGDSAITVRLPVSGLAANDRVYFRVVASSAAGTTRGSTRSFVTRRALLKPALQLAPSAPVYGQGLTVSGRLGGVGIANAPVALEADDFPFGDGWRELGRQNTRSDGSFAFTIPSLLVTTQLRVVTRTTPAIASDVRFASSRLAVGLLKPRRARTDRRRAVFSGRVLPVQDGARVSLQRRSTKGTWVPVRRSVTFRRGTQTRYLLSGRVPRAGATFRVVVSAADGGAHARGFSRERAVLFRRR
jgi:hypothetical protein